jgi:FKBP-type peptidyl-prolyl cis-trans isomerase FklB
MKTPLSSPTRSLLPLALASTLLLSVTGCQTSSDDDSAPSSPASAGAASSSDGASSGTGSGSATAGVVTTASGLRYRVLASGPASGRSPTLSDTVMVHYHGSLTDGTVFDSSLQRGQPATFGVGQVIPGWTEALQLMKPGDKWLISIPSQLAYGSRAVGAKIPPNSDLIFQVELLSVL